jgi:hypothetical protein
MKDFSETFQDSLASSIFAESNLGKETEGMV